MCFYIKKESRAIAKMTARCALWVSILCRKCVFGKIGMSVMGVCQVWNACNRNSPPSTFPNARKCVNMCTACMFTDSQSNRIYKNDKFTHHLAKSTYGTVCCQILGV